MRNWSFFFILKVLLNKIKIRLFLCLTAPLIILTIWEYNFNVFSFNYFSSADKTILLFCFRAVFSRTGEVNVSFSKDNGIQSISCNGLLQTPILKVRYLVVIFLVIGSKLVCCHYLLVTVFWIWTGEKFIEKCKCLLSLSHYIEINVIIWL